MSAELLIHWNHLLECLPENRQDVYFREEYLRLYETEKEKAVCFVYRESEKIFLLPFLKRNFSFQGKELHDFETAYGYGGPATNTGNENFLHSAWSSLSEYCRDHGYIAGFVRFHPLFQNHVGMEQIGTVINDRQTICMDLSGDTEDIWKREVHSKNRNMIRKAEKSGLRFLVDKEYSHLDKFKILYHETMNKLSADEFYFFSDSYYEQLRKTLLNSFLGLVYHGESIIAAAIFFYHGKHGHYHLAGSDKSALAFSPNNLLLWSAACKLKELGVERFHLGGGTSTCDSDSLLLFKKRFSPNRCDFRIGKIVFQRELYEKVCKDWLLKTPHEKVEKLQNILLKYKY